MGGPMTPTKTKPDGMMAVVLLTFFSCLLVFSLPFLHSRTGQKMLEDHEIETEAGQEGASFNYPGVEVQDESLGESVKYSWPKDPFVEKKTFSSALRLVYLVGLEGTGHHYFADALDKFCKNPEVPCPKVCNMSYALYPGIGNPPTTGDHLKGRIKLRKAMEGLAAAERSLPSGNSTMVSFGKCRWKSGMMSYPNFNGNLKALQYVDFKVLAEEAEHAGVDLRIVYLTRSAPDILISDTKHNNYGGTFMMEMRALLVNADVVKSTFSEIDSRFVTCLRYEDISDAQHATRVANFLAPTQDMAKRFAKTMLDAVKNKSQGRANPKKYKALSDPESAEFWLISRLQQKLDLIEERECGI